MSPRASKKGRSHAGVRPAVQTESSTLEEQPAESPCDVLVEVGEVVRRVPRAKVVTPTTEHRIEVRNDGAEIRVTPSPGRQVSHASAHPRQRGASPVSVLALL
jgi:hypothetical protein